MKDIELSYYGLGGRADLYTDRLLEEIRDYLVTLNETMLLIASIMQAKDNHHNHEQENREQNDI